MQRTAYPLHGFEVDAEKPWRPWRRGQHPLPWEPDMTSGRYPVHMYRIMDELLTYGRTQKPARPWLGMMTTEMDDALVVAGVMEGGPAQRADVRVGDFILGVGGQPVKELAEMFRLVWATGEAGVGIPLTLSRDGEMLDLTVQSVNRSDLLKSPQVH